MMSKTRIHRVIYILIGLALAGCKTTFKAGYSEPREIDVNTPEVKNTLSMITSTSEMKDAAPMITATSEIPIVSKNDEVVVDRFKAIDCEQDFCQIPQTGRLQRPFSNLDNVRIDLSYPYASTNNGLLDVHHGVEFQNAFGSVVLAAADGEVVFAGMDDQVILGPHINFYGNVVILRHPNLFEEKEIYTLYGHLSTIMVDVGDRVETSAPLGKVGASGAANGPHLHFEVRFEANDYAHTVNPALWFTPLEATDTTEQTSILAGVFLDGDGNLISEATFTIEKLAEDGSVQEAIYVTSYHNSGVNAHPLLGENFAICDLDPDDYRLSFVKNQLYELFFTLEPGMLGFVTLQSD